MKILQCVIFCCLLIISSTVYAGKQQQSPAHQATQETFVKEKEAGAPADEDLEKMLRSVSELKKKIKKQIETKTHSLDKNASNEEKTALAEELKKLQESLEQANDDFEKIATGIDIKIFNTPVQKTFDWKKEMFALMQPGVVELKRLTAEARKKTELLSKQDSYQKLLPVAMQAHENLQRLVKTTKDPELKKQLKALIPEWESLSEQLKNGLDITKIELAKMAGKKKSIMDSGKESLKNFFQTRGLYLSVSILACLGVVLVLRLIHRLIRRTIPGSNKEFRPIHIRIVDLCFQLLTISCGMLSFILVFYFFEDWLLLSFTIIFIAGLGWATKTALPKFWKQTQMILNFGNVREGERVILFGIPWRVKNINVRTRLENPALKETIKVPISMLFDKTSRTYDHKEPWFPCKKDDWVILSDGTRGGVVSLSHEQVELVLRGGAHKIYQTGDFLGLAPINLSRNFRIKEVFGIGYSHQAEATTTIPEKVAKFLEEKFETNGYSKEMLNLRVEFNAAGASSLDLVVIADFKGSQAPLYNRIRRAIQRWCVEACTTYGWDIPFPQLTVHNATILGEIPNE